jgi:hypothetical protein
MCTLYGIGSNRCTGYRDDPNTVVIEGEFTVRRLTDFGVNVTENLPDRRR